MTEAEADRDVRAARLASQLLAGSPARSPEDVVEHLLAVQAQDPRGFRLSVRSRSEGVLASDVEDALTERRSLVVTWLNRGTLHLVPAHDYWWLRRLTAPRLTTWSARRLRQEGVSEAQAERGMAVVEEAVAEGPQTRGDLRERLDAAGVPTARQAFVHVVMGASLRGDVVRGPVVGKEHAYVSATAWLGAAPAELDEDEALARLTRRYLAGHGPASPADLAAWTGLTLGDARRAFEAVAGDVVQPAGEPASLPPPRLLGPYDPVLHGWADRSPFVGPHVGVVTTNGLFRPFAMVDGRAVATWRIDRGVVTISPLERIPPDALEALVADAEEVLRFLGLPERPAVVG